MMWKKLLLFLAFLVIVSIVFAGTIDFWHSLMGSKEAARLQLIADFEAKTGIKVNDNGFFDIFQWQQKTLAAVASGMPPEIGSNHYYFVPQYAARGVLEPLDDHFKDWGVDPYSIFPSNILDMTKYKGKIYGVPLFITARVLIYNKDMFKEAGLDPDKPPTTWEELFEYAKKLTIWKNGKLERAGIHLATSPEMRVNFFEILLWEFGGDLLNSDQTKAIFNSEAGVKALKLYKKFFDEKLTTLEFGEGTTGATEPFIARKAAMRFAGPYDLVNLKKYAPDLNFGVALLPKPSDGDFATLIDSFSVFAFKGAKNKKDALEFIKFCIQKETQLKFAKASFRLPAHVEALADPTFSSDERYKIFAEAIKYGKAVPTIPEWTEVHEVILDAIERVLYKNEDPKVVLDEAVEKVNTQILNK